MRILIADKFPADHVELLESRGHSCETASHLDASTLPGAIAGFDALIVRSTKVEADTIAAADRLALIIRAGAGVNTIDRGAAADRGIYVCNTPGKNAIAVAELTIGLITALDRRIPDAVADLRAGRWRKKEYATARGLAGRQLGIVGFGDIGVAVAERAVALRMEVIVVDKPGRDLGVLDKISELDCRLVPDMETLLRVSDVVSIHVPANADTKGMVSAEFLAHMKEGAFLVNTSRSDVIDEAALLAAIDGKGLRVGLDVFDGEPASGDAEFHSTLARHPNVYGTHHIGASTEQSQNAIADEVVALVDDFSRGAVRNCVNLLAEDGGTSTLTVRHHNRVGVLADVLAVLRGAGLNVEHMQNHVFAGAAAATATIRVSGEVAPQTLADLADQQDVIGVSHAAL